MDGNLRVATLDDLPDVTSVMATAFSHDPAWGPYSFPDDDRRVDQLAAFWGPQLRAAMRFPWTFVTPECEAAAVWIPPGEPEMTPEQQRDVEALTVGLVGQEQADVIFAVFEQLEQQYPHDPPHFYLSLLATHDDHRGRGLGMALLGDSLRVIDELGMPAYLESTNPGNNERYMRHGFQPVGGVTMANGHRITTMWREPGGV
jgi:GNAT superfamily N-acetyltransferase